MPAEGLAAVKMVVEDFTEQEYEASSLRELKKIEERVKGCQ
jgi:hypothetical protein